MRSASRNAVFSLRPFLTSVLLLVVYLSPASNRQTSAIGFGSLQSARAAIRYSATDEQFLEDIERRSFRYFWDQADPKTGLVPDRARMDAGPLDQDHQNVGSIAATGFGLTALCIGAEHHWIESTQARERTRNTLRFFAHQA